MTSATTSEPQAHNPPRVRASDADRNATVELLQDAITRGLLTHDEGGQRMAAAFAATHRDQLPPLTADLPPVAPVKPAASGWRAVWMMLAVQLRQEVQATRAAGIRSKRFVITVLAALCLLALVVLGIVSAFHGGPGFDGGGRGFGGDR